MKKQVTFYIIILYNIIISPLHFKATPRKIVLNAKTIHQMSVVVSFQCYSRIIIETLFINILNCFIFIYICYFHFKVLVIFLCFCIGRSSLMYFSRSSLTKQFLFYTVLKKQVFMVVVYYNNPVSFCKMISLIRLSDSLLITVAAMAVYTGYVFMPQHIMAILHYFEVVQ